MGISTEITRYCVWDSADFFSSICGCNDFGMAANGMWKGEASIVIGVTIRWPVGIFNGVNAFGVLE
jgi:hypothetical protein